MTISLQALVFGLLLNMSGSPWPLVFLVMAGTRLLCVGAVRVKVPRGRERSGTGMRLYSVFLPPYIRRSKSLVALLSWLSLKGASTGDCSEALQALWGPEAPGLSPATISRLTQSWQEELPQWQRRDRSGKRYGYCWVDGVYCKTRLEEARPCILVILGADATGHQEFVGLWDGSRASEQAWKALLLDRKSRGLGARASLG